MADLELNFKGQAQATNMEERSDLKPATNQPIIQEVTNELSSQQNENADKAEGEELESEPRCTDPLISPVATEIAIPAADEILGSSGPSESIAIDDNASAGTTTTEATDSSTGSSPETSLESSPDSSPDSSPGVATTDTRAGMTTGTKRRPSILKMFGLVALLTIASKVMGLVRDIVQLQYFGTSPVSDAYNYAYLVTGYILVLFGGLGGPFHSSTVAVLAGKRDDPRLGRLVGQLLAVTVVILGLLTLSIWFLAPIAVPVVWPATGHPLAARHELWTLIISQLRIMLPLIVIAGVVGISYGVLNVFDDVASPSISPAISSIAMIAAIVLLPDKAGMCLAIGTVVGAFGQMLIQMPGLIRCLKGKGLSVSLTPEPGLWEYSKMLWPAVFSTSIGQLTVFVDTFFTSQLDVGGWTAIFNANKLIQLPLGVLLTAMLMPILPRFTELVAAKKVDELKDEYRRSVRFLWFLSLPMGAILLAMPKAIVELLFARGHFDERSADLMTVALVWMIPSMFFYVARDLITRVYYAHQDSRTPYRVAIAALLVKAILDWLLVKPLGVGGISLSTTLVTVFNLTVLSYFLRPKIGSLGVSKLVRPVSIMLLASTGCWAISAFVAAHFPHNLVSSKFANQFLLISSSSIAGIFVYITVCLLLRLEETGEAIKRIKQKLRK